MNTHHPTDYMLLVPMAGSSTFYLECPICHHDQVQLLSDNLWAAITGFWERHDRCRAYIDAQERRDRDDALNATSYR